MTLLLIQTRLLLAFFFFLQLEHTVGSFKKQGDHYIVSNIFICISYLRKYIKTILLLSVKFAILKIWGNITGAWEYPFTILPLASFSLVNCSVCFKLQCQGLYIGVQHILRIRAVTDYYIIAKERMQRQANSSASEIFNSFWNFHFYHLPPSPALLGYRSKTKGYIPLPITVQHPMQQINISLLSDLV